MPRSPSITTECRAISTISAGLLILRFAQVGRCYLQHRWNCTSSSLQADREGMARRSDLSDLSFGSTAEWGAWKDASDILLRVSDHLSCQNGILTRSQSVVRTHDFDAFDRGLILFWNMIRLTFVNLSLCTLLQNFENC